MIDVQRNGRAGLVRLVYEDTVLRNPKHELRWLEFFPVVDSERETHKMA